MWFAELFINSIMTKIITTLIVFCLVCPQLSAQTDVPSEKQESRDAKRKVVTGLKVGLVRSSAYARSGFTSKYRSGLSAGLFASLPVGSLLGIQPEISYMQKGLDGSGVVNGESYRFSRVTSHIDIPVQVQLKLFRWLTFLAGPQYSFLLGQRETYSLGGGGSALRAEFDRDEPTQGLWGFVSGFDINIRHIVFSFRSGWDLTASHDYSSAVTPRYRNQWMQYTIGYRFY